LLGTESNLPQDFLELLDQSKIRVGLAIEEIGEKNIFLL